MKPNHLLVLIPFLLLPLPSVLLLFIFVLLLFLLQYLFSPPPASDGIGQPIVETIHCDALCDGQVSDDFQINCQINWELDAWLYIDYNSLSPTDNQVMRSLTLLWANPRFVQMLPPAKILLTRQLDASPFDLYIGPVPLSKTTQLDYNWPKNNNYNWPNGFSFCWGAKMSRKGSRSFCNKDWIWFLSVIFEFCVKGNMKWTIEYSEWGERNPSPINNWTTDTMGWS